MTMKISAGEYWKEYNYLGRTDILSTLTATMEVGNIDYWAQNIGDTWMTNTLEIVLPF